MQFYSLHHCVLLFLILTFTTAPVSALEVCPTRGKLHQPVKLSCTHRCSRSLKWSLLNNRTDVQAQCDQTSCRSEPGFNISHDQYQRGDLSLTITAADYSQRNVYACECEDSDFAYVRLVIETVFSPVQMESGEDLKLHVSVPEPVEVIYKSSGSADEVICRVNNLSLQCKDEYRDRTSLTYPEITLRHVEPRDSGSYTIRDTENDQDIQIYAVSVEDKPGVPVWGIVLIVLSLLICAAVGMYFLWKHLMRKQLERRKQLVDQFVQQAVGGTEEKNREVEESLSQLEKQYIITEYSAEVSVFCREKRRQLLERRKQLVDQIVQQAVGGTEEKVSEVEEKIREVEESLNQLKLQYNNTEYSAEVSEFCREKMKQLLDRRLLRVVPLVQQVEEGKQKISEVEKKINDLEKSYLKTVYLRDVKSFCDMKRLQLKWYSLQHEEHRVTEKRELNSRLVLVDQLVQRYKGGTEEKINEVKRKINLLQELYMNTKYYKQVKVLCEIKRKQLDTGGPQYVAMTEETPLEKEMIDVEQCVHEAIEGVKEKISEAEEKIYQLELHMTSEDFVEVSGFCMYMRAELFWSRLLHSDKDQIMTDNIEILWKVEEVMNSLQKVRDGVKREQKILISTEVDEMKKHLTEIEKWCEEKKER